MGQPVKFHLPLPITSHRSHYHLNHTLSSSVEKLSSVKPVPDARKVGDTVLTYSSINQCCMEKNGVLACLKAFTGEVSKTCGGEEGIIYIKRP